MVKKWWAVGAIAWWASASGQAASLTETETEWLDAATPVIAYASQQGLPVDIVVQPQDTAGTPPLAMAFVQQRCKLVLSMRGNPAVKEALAGVAARDRALIIETMAAHELGHCWRHVQGQWAALPAGFTDISGALDLPASELARLDLQKTRREEGFSDLVALAWVRARHPDQYREVQQWLARVRADQPVSGGSHDTRVWVRLAADAQAWRKGPSIFEQALPLWSAGVAALQGEPALDAAAR